MGFNSGFKGLISARFGSLESSFINIILCVYMYVYVYMSTIAFSNESGIFLDF